jgi:hypothetical protein
MRILREIRSGQGVDWAELHEQCCHQMTVGEVAYAVVPHAVDIAGRIPLRERLWPLAIAGEVAACCAAFPSQTPAIPEDLSDAYKASALPALRLALDALNQQVWRPGEVTDLMGVVAAFHG